MGDPGRFDFENRLQMVNRFLERFINLEVFQVTDVLAQESTVTTGQADRVFQLCANGQYA